MKTQKWSAWGGYRDVTAKMKELGERMERIMQIHLLNAPGVVASIVKKNQFLREENFKNFKLFLVCQPSRMPIMF